MNQLPIEKKIQVLNALVEGNSIRSIVRMLDVHKTTILRILNEVGELASEILDREVVNLKCKYVQCDELWCYVTKKQKNCTRMEKQIGEVGDQYIFVAMDSETKLIISHKVSKRNTENATALIRELNYRIPKIFQLSTDQFFGYKEAVSNIFGIDIDFGTVHKHYSEEVITEKRYSPAKIAGVTLRVLRGFPQRNRISTSHVERQNLTMRMCMRRLTRLSNAFSKKLENLKSAIAIHFFYYNFIRIHQTLRVTPAMEAGITRKLWNWKDLLYLQSNVKVA
ncbi:MAG: IS1 family transposase [Bacteroidetes bacterium]|nr:IS1 family transposase [Bacteroidota bacterium]